MPQLLETPVKTDLTHVSAACSRGEGQAKQKRRSRELYQSRVFSFRLFISLGELQYLCVCACVRVCMYRGVRGVQFAINDIFCCVQLHFFK